jgi:flavin-dependent dehydrogenase
MGRPVVHVAGGGLAGSTAAIAALRKGAGVVLYEPSRFPRHKVCGEFLSPGVTSVLRALDLDRDFFAAGPAPVRRMMVRIGRAEKRGRLPETAWGLSRYSLDALLIQKAALLGAEVRRERAPSDLAGPVVTATGRAPGDDAKGKRIFGFKAHFAGPTQDAVELFFFSGSYIGLNPVEGGLTNVCGLGPECDLAKFGFDIDEMLDTVPEVRARLAPLQRAMEWMNVGPLAFRNRFDEPPLPNHYAAGDALSFVDPFTGSGMLSAMLSGRIAGAGAAMGEPSSQCIAEAKRQLHRPFEVAHFIRDAIGRGWAEKFLPLVPGSLLFRLTRP